MYDGAFCKKGSFGNKTKLYQFGENSKTLIWDVKQIAIKKRGKLLLICVKTSSYVITLYRVFCEYFALKVEIPCILCDVKNIAIIQCNNHMKEDSKDGTWVREVLLDSGDHQ